MRSESGPRRSRTFARHPVWARTFRRPTVTRWRARRRASHDAPRGDASTMATDRIRSMRTDGLSRLWSLFLVAMVLLAYGPVVRNDFVSYDDTQLIRDNPIVAGGL